MSRIYINKLKDHIGEEVIIAGWIDVRRDHGKLTFLDIRDRTGIVQSVVSSQNEDAHTALKEARSEWVLELRGVVKERPEKMRNPEMKTGDIEFEIIKVKVLGKASELPFEKEEKLNFDTYLDYMPLTLRTDRARAIFKVQAHIVQAFREFLCKNDFVEFQAPKIIGEDAEGGASVFEIDYFGKTAHLAQSPQFYKQIMVGVYEKVFSVGNVFRAEKHSTSRHLNEYTSMDIEFGFINDHEDVMKFTGELMKYIMSSLTEREETKEAIEFLEAHVPNVPDIIPSLKLREAQKIIKEHYGEECSEEPDLAPQHERWIGEYAEKELGSDFIFITHFPGDKRPMYTMDDEDDIGYTKGFDLLFRGLEINTGGQRVHEYDMLVNKMKKRNLNPELFSFYLQAFKYGMPPHGGFGMGLERLTAQLLGLQNVKEATLFPREINRIDTLLS
jgi:nondiscriminating aspartyl-tRNA synthetase